MAFGGSTSANTKPHTHNQTLQNDGGDLSETLTDMNGVALYSLITDNTAAVAANTVNIATNTAAIAAIGEVPSGGVITYTLSGIPAGWTLYEDIASTISQTTQDRGRDINTGTGSSDRNQMGQQFNTGSLLVGKNPETVTWYMYKDGSPTGTIYAYITDSLGAIRETSTTTLDPSTLPTGDTNAIGKDFTFTGNTILAAGDMITIQYTVYSSGNTVGIKCKNTGVVANEAFRQNNQPSAGLWSSIANEAATYDVTWALKYIRKT